MSFFESHQPNLDGDLENVAVYTWGEESYDGLSEALQEGGDELNDETFGDVGTVGKDFDFANPVLPDDYRGPGDTIAKDQNQSTQEQVPPRNMIYDKPSSEGLSERPLRATPQSLESIWDSKSPFSALPPSNGKGRSGGQQSILSDLSSYRPPSIALQTFTSPSSITNQQQPGGHSNVQGKIPSVQEIEDEMRLAAQRNRLQGMSSIQQPTFTQEARSRQQDEVYLAELAHQNRLEQDPRRQLFEQNTRSMDDQQRLYEQEQRRLLLEQEHRRHLLLEQERRILLEQELERQQQLEFERQQLLQLQHQEQQRLQLQRLMQQQQQMQRGTPPPRMLPASQSPRFFEHQQLLQLQQQQERLQMEELQRQMMNNLTLQQQSDPRRRFGGAQDAEVQVAQLYQQQQQRRQRSQSPAVSHQLNASSQDAAPQNIQLQQRLLSEMAQAEFLREMQASTPRQAEQQEALRAEAMRKILEAEKMEEKRRRKAAKIAHMSRYNDLMTQSDKDFITRIQVSQLVTQDPYADDFYAQVYGAILRTRMGLQSSDERVLKFGSGGGVGLGLTSQKGNYRRPSAMQRMEQQVERIVSNARKREEEKVQHSLQNLQGALGKIAGRSYKAAPRPLLQVDSGTAGGSPNISPAHAHISKASVEPLKEGAAEQAAKLARAALGNVADNYNLVQKEPLSHREVLVILENLYDLVLSVEQHKRDQPLSEEEQEKQDGWQKTYDIMMDTIWEELRVMVPLEISDPHPFISLLGPSKGKKILPRLTRHLGSQRMLTLLTLLVACFGQPDVVRNASLLDSLEETSEWMDAERQTNAFLGSVMQSVLPVVAKLNLRLVTGLLGLLLDRSHIATVARTKPGLALLTLFLSRVEVMKQSISSGTLDAAEMPSTEEAQHWKNMFDHLFDLLAPHMLLLFPSSRISASSSLEQIAPYDNADQHVWQFLAAFALHGTAEQHQILVATLREKILDNLLAVSRGWFTTEEERNIKLGNVNLFLNALGLDSSQIAL